MPSQKEAVKATGKAKAPSEKVKFPSEKPSSSRNDKKQDEAKKDGVKNDAKKDEANEPTDVAVFTPEQDAQLLLLKLQNKTWRDISQQMGKPAELLRHRFREIKPSAFDATTENKRRHDKDKHEGKKDYERLWKERKQEYQRKQSSPSATAYPPASVISSATLGVFQLEEDENFSYGEIQALVEILDADMSMVWDRVASNFYSISGRRVLPSVIKEKLLG